MSMFHILIVFATILTSDSLFADGIKDFYPDGIVDLHAYLKSSTESAVN